VSLSLPGRGLARGETPSPEIFLLFYLKMEHFDAVFKLDLTEETRMHILARGRGNCLLLSHTGYAYETDFDEIFRRLDMANGGIFGNLDR